LISRVLLLNKDASSFAPSWGAVILRIHSQANPPATSANTYLSKFRLYDQEIAYIVAEKQFLDEAKMKLENRVAIITGAGSGMGRATAILFSQEGAKVCVADANEKNGLETVKLIKDKGGDAFFVHTDVRKEEDLKKMVRSTVDKYGKLDILFNNAGVLEKPTNVEDITEDSWNKTIDTDLKGVVLGTKHAIPELKKTKGAVISTASHWGVRAYPGYAAYNAAKAGVISFTMTAALELIKDGIRVNCIAPGGVWTPMCQGFVQASADPVKAKKQLESLYPIGRMSEPEEIARAVLFLASDDSPLCVGTCLVVDGGSLARIY
jgi:NAD(P)-dependent dehydrogenase (short-subunit alcohol dehydrogenase family)